MVLVLVGFFVDEVLQLLSAMMVVNEVLVIVATLCLVGLDVDVDC